MEFCQNHKRLHFPNTWVSEKQWDKIGSEGQTDKIISLSLHFGLIEWGGWCRDGAKLPYPTRSGSEHFGLLHVLF
jgi:hypothetical protein